MRLPPKCKEQLLIYLALVWIGTYYFLAAVGVGMLIDIILGMAVGKFEFPVTKCLLLKSWIGSWWIEGR